MKERYIFVFHENSLENEKTRVTEILECHSSRYYNKRLRNNSLILIYLAEVPPLQTSHTPKLVIHTKNKRNGKMKRRRHRHRCRRGCGCVVV